MSLRDTRFLVADDQKDVASTLTRPLREAGASLKYVTDGRAALGEVVGGGYDMLLVDMKMPPEEWGGLWLLAELRGRNISLPAVVLSGEGQKRQTIEAHRLGAADWVDKGHGGTELLERCENLWQHALDAAIPKIVAEGPSLIAYPYARFNRWVGSERQYDEAVRTLPELVRFVALFGLAASDPEKCGPLRASPVQMAKPAFGLWISIVDQLVKAAAASPVFRSLAQQIMPQGSQQWFDIGAGRNDLGHGSADLSHIDDASHLLRTCAHRLAAAPPIRIGSHATLDFDGNSYRATMRQYTGALPPIRTTWNSDTPLRSSGTFASVRDQVFDLEPWTYAADADQENSGISVLRVFDGVHRTHGQLNADDELVYVDTASGKRKLRRRDRNVTWAKIADWFSSTEVATQG
jgi:CheY-like chemotaxis protein